MNTAIPPSIDTALDAALDTPRTMLARALPLITVTDKALGSESRPSIDDIDMTLQTIEQLVRDAYDGLDPVSIAQALEERVQP